MFSGFPQSSSETPEERNRRMEGSLRSSSYEMMRVENSFGTDVQQNNKRSRLSFANQIPSESPEGLRPSESPLLCPVAPAYKRVRTDTFLMTSRDKNRFHQSTLAREFLAAAESSSYGEGGSSFSLGGTSSYRSSSFCVTTTSTTENGPSIHDYLGRETGMYTATNMDCDEGHCNSMEATSDKDTSSSGESHVSDVSTVTSSVPSPPAPSLLPLSHRSPEYMSLGEDESAVGPTLLHTRNGGGAGRWGPGGGKAVAEMLRAYDYVYM
ncbi:hypothetical protein CSUI_003088 [Cystoisospora suis]|uniref:Uncharacterized protein n=1 Tax=Cystoisospora suis TaxID=483139 RepID=A0A2C6L6S2_9APIC|nr:hypothetical protein CSUI_003088 [Cystoisospora suis]